MRTVSPEALYRREKAKRGRRLAPLIAAAKQQLATETEAWHAKRRARRTKKAKA